MKQNNLSCIYFNFKTFEALKKSFYLSTNPDPCWRSWDKCDVDPFSRVFPRPLGYSLYRACQACRTVLQTSCTFNYKQGWTIIWIGIMCVVTKLRPLLQYQPSVSFLKQDYIFAFHSVSFIVTSIKRKCVKCFFFSHTIFEENIYIYIYSNTIYIQDALM